MLTGKGLKGSLGIEKNYFEDLPLLLKSDLKMCSNMEKTKNIL